jgi:predicted nucleic acid-binding protein
VNRVLVDTSVWVAHFRIANPLLQSLLATDRVFCHALIVIEVACGNLPAPRARTLEDIKKFQQAVIATSDETLALIEGERCYDAGCGDTDVAVLASALLTADTRLSTVVKDLAELAARLGVAFAAEGVAPPA